jgi:hypothetical protein
MEFQTDDSATERKSETTVTRSLFVQTIDNLRRNVRQFRKMDELIQDPNFTYQIGRLVGASEMAAHHMKTHGDEETKSVGGALSNVVDWFFVSNESQKALPKGKS